MRLRLISIIIQRFHSFRNPCWYDVNSQQGTEAESVGNEDIKAWLCLSYNAFELLEVRHWISKEIIKVALGVCFALKSWKEYLLLFTYLITLGKDVTFPLITKFKTNSSLSYLFVNRIPNYNVASPINS